MIPLRDENPTYIRPYMTWLIVAINIVIFYLQATGGMAETRTGLAGPMAGWTMVPREITQGENVPINGESLRPFWLTIFTSMFMHGGLMHLGGNMLYLIIFGNNIEDSLGHVKFVVFYIVCGVLAAAAQIFWNPNSAIPMLGASGAVAGVLGAYLLLFPHSRVYTAVFLGFFITTVRLPALVLLGFWIVSQFFGHVTGALAAPEGRETGGIAYMAHIGGFVGGLLLIKLFGPHPHRRSPNAPYRPRYLGDDGHLRL